MNYYMIRGRSLARGWRPKICLIPLDMGDLPNFARALL